MKKTERIHRYPNNYNSRQCITCIRKMEADAFCHQRERKSFPASVYQRFHGREHLGAGLQKVNKDGTGRIQEGLRVLRRHVGRDTPGTFPDDKHCTQPAV